MQKIIRTTKGANDPTIVKLLGEGWKIKTTNSQSQGYSFNRTCCLGFIFLPLALLGKKKDVAEYVLEKKSDAGNVDNEVINEKIDSILSKTKSFLAKSKPFFSKVRAKLAVVFASRFAKGIGKVGILALPWLILVLGIAQIAFGVMVYKYKSESRAVKIAAKAIPYPVAIINGNIVTYNDYLSEKNYIHHFYDKTQQGGINYTDIDNQVLDQLIENQIIDLESWKYKVTVKQSDVDNTVSAIADQNGGQDKVTKVLADLYGLDLNSFKHLVKTQLLRDKVNQEVIVHITARHILIRVDKDAPADQVAAAKAKIDDLYNQVKGGADFAEVAKKSSEDVGSNEAGGLLDPFARGDMVQQFEDVAFVTPVGSISEPVRSDFGWHIIKVESKSGKVDKKFADWLSEIKAKSLVLKFI